MDEAAARQRFRRSLPPAEGLARMAREVAGRGARVVQVRRLGGGLATATAGVDIETPRSRRRVVLKRFVPGDDRAEAEWLRLGFAAARGLPSPGPLALSPPGGWFDTWAIAMERSVGRPVGPVDDTGRWVAGLADTMAAVHATPAAGAPAPMHQGWDGWAPLEWGGARGRRGERARAALDTRPPHDGPTVLHGDLHPGNTLWRRGRLVTLVDWAASRLGQPVWELAYTRTDVVVVAGIRAADALRDAYVERTGADVRALPLYDVECGLSALAMGQAWVAAYRLQGVEVAAGPALARVGRFVDRALAELGA